MSEIVSKVELVPHSIERNEEERTYTKVVEGYMGRLSALGGIETSLASRLQLSVNTAP